jgi:hypothetical protein
MFGFVSKREFQRKIQELEQRVSRTEGSLADTRWDLRDVLPGVSDLHKRLEHRDLHSARHDATLKQDVADLRERLDKPDYNAACVKLYRQRLKLERQGRKAHEIKEAGDVKGG